MPAEERGAQLSIAELAAVDALITQLQQEGVAPDEQVALWTPVATVVVRCAVHTLAVVCVYVPSDEDKIAEIARIANTLESTTTLNTLLETRARAVRASTQLRDNRNG